MKLLALAVFPVSVAKDIWDYLYIAFTGGLVFVGAGTLILLWWQAKKTAESTAAMRKNIALQFRPKLIVRKVVLEAGTIRYTIANTGGTTARIVHIHALADYVHLDRRTDQVANRPAGTALTRGQIIRPPEYTQEFDLRDQPVFEAGEDQDLHLNLDQTSTEIVDHLRDRNAHGMTNPQLTGAYSIRGEIEYCDEIGIKRKTGFLRRLNIESKNFLPADNPDYEYVD